MSHGTVKRMKLGEGQIKHTLLPINNTDAPTMAPTTHTPTTISHGGTSNSFFKLSQENKELLSLILDDITMSGSMPKLTQYLRDYEFYPPDADPENMSLRDHCYHYLDHPSFLCLYYANIVLRGVAQVYICNNPVTGLFVCIGLCITSPVLMMYALIGSAVSNLGAFLMVRPATEEFESGLFG